MIRVRWLWLTVMLLFILTPAAFSAGPPQGAGEAVLVGRIADVEGQLLRYVPAEKDWVATVKDAPFGLEDALYSDQNSKAEFIFPNNTWVRTGGDTQIQLITLKSDVTVVDVASGVTRFFNKSSNVVIQATTPFGYVTAQPGAIFDLYVGDQSAEAIALTGEVDFVHSATGSKYEVAPKSSSLIADAREVAPGEGNVDADWDDWNAARDNLWSKRLAVRGDSTKYLPTPIQDDAYTLEENGRWETVQYEGQSRSFWRPTQVSAGWAPFSVGRWTEWYGDNCWVPDEPFGYVTHHYGNWVFVNNYWYWSPPVVSVGVGVAVAPGVSVGLGWYPGRVAWISSGVNVGWIPLAPAEPYYSHRYWGPGAIVVENPASININIGHYSYVSHAVVISQNNFFSANNYNRVRVTNINQTTIINNFHSSPVVNNTVINNYTSNRQRFNFTDANVANKPHAMVLNRIEHNEKFAAQEGQRINAQAIRNNVTGAKTGSMAQPAAVQAPKITNKIVPLSEMNKPASQMQFQEKQIKQNVRSGKDVQVQGLPGRNGAGQTGQPGTAGPGTQGQGSQPGVTSPRESGQTGQSGTSRPGATGQTVQPGATGTGTQGQGGQPGVTSPRESGQAGQSGTSRPGGTIQPARPGATGTGTQGQGSQPGVTSPRESGQTGQSGTSRPGGTIQPARPGATGTGTQGQSSQPGVTSPRESGQAGQSGTSRPGGTIQPARPGATGTGTQGQSSQPGVTSPRESGQTGQSGTSRPGGTIQPARPGATGTGTQGQSSQPGVTSPRESGQAGQSGTNRSGATGQTVQPGTTGTRTQGQSSQPGVTSPRESGQSSQPGTNRLGGQGQGQSSQPGITRPGAQGQSSQPGVTSPRESGQSGQSGQSGRQGFGRPGESGQGSQPGANRLGGQGQGQSSQPGMTRSGGQGQSSQPGVTSPRESGQSGQSGQSGRQGFGRPGESGQGSQPGTNRLGGQGQSQSSQPGMTRPGAQGQSSQPGMMQQAPRSQSQAPQKQTAPGQSSDKKKTDDKLQ